MARRARLSTNSVVASAAVVAVAMFGMGFVISYQPSSGTTDVATASTTAPEPTTTTAPPDTATSRPPTTGAPSTVTLAPTTVFVPPTTTFVAPSTTVAAPTTTVTLPTTTVAAEPGHLVVNYPHTEEGQMLMVAGGTSAIVLRNDGGEALSFRVDSAGAVVVGANGTATGALFPDETLSVPITAKREPNGPGPHATIAIFTNVGLVTTIQVTLT
jgi:hypothetical protein